MDTVAERADLSGCRLIHVVAAGRHTVRGMQEAQKRPQKRPCLPSEDQILRDAIASLGAPDGAGRDNTGDVRWSDIAQAVPDRSTKQCRERWRHNLDPTIKRGPWSTGENEILLARHEQLGSKWAEISLSLPGRTDNACKNQWKNYVLQ